MPTATQPKPLEVQLLVCPTCRTVQMVDAVVYRGRKGKASCTGPIGDGHRRVRCQPVTFREVLGDG